jgi:hypothetical protein
MATKSYQLLRTLTQLGIRLEADGDRLRYAPRSAVTPDLAKRMKAHKPELLAMLRPSPRTEESADELLDELAQRGCLLGLDEAGGLVMDDVPLDMAGAVTDHEAELTRNLRVEAASMAEAIGRMIDPPAPCQKCRSLELWQILAGNWRCLRCDPPSRNPENTEIR